MHEMLVGHGEHGGIVPRRGELFPAGQRILAPASFTVQVEALDPIMDLGDVRRLNGTGASWLGAGERFVLEGPHEQIVRGEAAERRNL
jgi:hypothetical protein